MNVIIAGALVQIKKLPFNGRDVRYISSDAVPPKEVIKFFEALTGKQELKWVITRHEQFRRKLLITGISFLTA